jgi:hypothetical protein
MERSSKPEESSHSWLKHWPRAYPEPWGRARVRECVTERLRERERESERARENESSGLRESERENNFFLLGSHLKLYRSSTHFLVFAASGSSDTPTHSLIIHVDINDDDVDQPWHVKKTPPCVANCTGNCCTFIFFQSADGLFNLFN